MIRIKSFHPTLFLSPTFSWILFFSFTLSRKTTLLNKSSNFFTRHLYCSPHLAAVSNILTLWCMSEGQREVRSQAAGPIKLGAVRWTKSPVWHTNVSRHPDNCSGGIFDRDGGKLETREVNVSYNTKQKPWQTEPYLKKRNLLLYL